VFFENEILNKIKRRQKIGGVHKKIEKLSFILKQIFLAQVEPRRRIITPACDLNKIRS